VWRRLTVTSGGGILLDQGDDAENDQQRGEGEGAVVDGRVEARGVGKQLSDVESFDAQELGMLDGGERGRTDDEAENKQDHGVSFG